MVSYRTRMSRRAAQLASRAPISRRSSELTLANSGQELRKCHVNRCFQPELGGELDIFKSVVTLVPGDFRREPLNCHIDQVLKAIVQENKNLQLEFFSPLAEFGL